MHIRPAGFVFVAEIFIRQLKGRVKDRLEVIFYSVSEIVIVEQDAD